MMILIIQERAIMPSLVWFIEDAMDTEAVELPNFGSYKMHAITGLHVEVLTLVPFLSKIRYVLPSAAIMS